jgi:hypothetical protein
MSRVRKLHLPNSAELEAEVSCRGELVITSIQLHLAAALAQIPKSRVYHEMWTGKWWNAIQVSCVPLSLQWEICISFRVEQAPYWGCSLPSDDSDG